MIEEELFRDIKVEAAETGRTISDIVEDALRKQLHRPSRQRTCLKTHGQGGIAIDLSDPKSWPEEMQGV